MIDGRVGRVLLRVVVGRRIDGRIDRVGRVDRRIDRRVRAGDVAVGGCRVDVVLIAGEGESLLGRDVQVALRVDAVLHLLGVGRLRVRGVVRTARVGRGRRRRNLDHHCVGRTLLHRERSAHGDGLVALLGHRVGVGVLPRAGGRRVAVTGEGLTVEREVAQLLARHRREVDDGLNGRAVLRTVVDGQREGGLRLPPGFGASRYRDEEHAHDHEHQRHDGADTLSDCEYHEIPSRQVAPLREPRFG